MIWRTPPMTPQSTVWPSLHDGKRPRLLGEPGAKGRDHLLQQNNGGDHLGLRVGDWKLIREPLKKSVERTGGR